MQDRDINPSTEISTPAQKGQIVAEQLDLVREKRLANDLGPTGVPKIRLTPFTEITVDRDNHP